MKIVRTLSGETEATLLPMLRARMPRASDMAMDEMSNAEAAVIEQQIDALARRFGGIDLVAQRLASLAVQKSQGEVDDRLKASIKSSLKIVAGGVTQTDTTLSASVTAGRRALAFGWTAAGGGYIVDSLGNSASFGSITLPTGLTQKNIGSSISGEYLNDQIEKIQTCLPLSQ